MTQTTSVWLVVLPALLVANLPFICNRLFSVLVLKSPKSLAVRLAELLILTFAFPGFTYRYLFKHRV